MVDKGLDEATRRFIPELAGYADVFNGKYDKNYMSRVPLDEMVKYGGGDTDAGFRLAQLLTQEGMKDSKNWNCYRRIQMPALRTFFEMESAGCESTRRNSTP